MKIVAINGSPRMEKGYTAMLLTAFLQGTMNAGADVELFYASRLNVKPCSCGQMYCWYVKPGECVIKDDMEMLHSKLAEAEIMVLATPVYIPLPGDMQNVINRLCPLMVPALEFRSGRTRARFRKHVNVRKIVLVATGGWWEKENLTTVVRIAEELAEDVSVEFAGAVLRPHVHVMKKDGKLTKDGQAILDEVKKAGYELIKEGKIESDTLKAISRPLISEEELRKLYNNYI
ncbi:flavodoxin family protein [Kosmotoga pacifica]|uniref:Iron-sulfur flavoprotein n=1 Tax=Kosmotoga pacifica TaxID=1330330 RepID=A0A0G2ZBM7_9BACT|nr:flavodoxin family protein [Kosmotoga pacifica]AKI97476.1 iron-sulfur flavoprotein [Kosmotoga pacifica]